MALLRRTMAFRVAMGVVLAIGAPLTVRLIAQRGNCGVYELPNITSQIRH